MDSHQRENKIPLKYYLVITGPPWYHTPLQGETTDNDENKARIHCSQGKQLEFLKSAYKEAGHLIIDKMMSGLL